MSSGRSGYWVGCFMVRSLAPSQSAAGLCGVKHCVPGTAPNSLPGTQAQEAAQNAQLLAEKVDKNKKVA